MKNFSIFLAFTAVVLAVAYIFMKPHAEDKSFENIRLVQTITVSSSTAEKSVLLTGEVRAENEAGLGFRLDGKMISRPASLGDIIKPGQIVAYLDPQDMTNKLAAAKADLVAAQAELTETTSNEHRQRTLFQQGVAPEMRFEEAQRALGVARARAEAAQAQVKLAQDQLQYTELKSDIAGTVTETLAEAGEVVRAGQVILRVAQAGGRDAVFNVPEGLMHAAEDGKELEIKIALSNNPDVHVTGHIREISPQADPVTRTFTVKVGLIDPPPEVRLGSVVTGSAGRGNKIATIRIPSMALTRKTGEPAVWVVNREGQVSLRNVEISQYDQSDVIVREGLQEGDVVVTAGVHTLYPNQKVKTGGTPWNIEPAEGPVK